MEKIRTDSEMSTRCHAPRGRYAMSLFFEAAEALVADYLNGRTLPEAVHKAAVLAVRTRLLNGKVPILDEMLCSETDSEASEPVSTSATRRTSS